MSAPPVFTQNTLREGFIEFAFGEPDPALLPVGLVREAAARALGAGGAAALAGFAPGRRFRTDEDDRSLRLCFSLFDEASLAAGARRLDAAVAEETAGSA